MVSISRSTSRSSTSCCLFYRGASSAHGFAPLEEEALSAARGVRGADLSAPVHPVQVEVRRGPHSRGDAGGELQPRRGGEAHQQAPQGDAAAGQERLHLHEALQEHAAGRSRDDLSEYAREVPPVRQGQARRDGRRRHEHGGRSAPPARSPPAALPRPIPLRSPAPSPASAASLSARPRTS